MTDNLSPKSGITFLKTKDMEETTCFYTNVMDLELVLEQSNCRIFKICTNSYLGFCTTDGETGSEEVIVTLEIEDVDGYYQVLEKKGVEIEVQPRLNEKYQIYQMFLRDPNGYLIEIQRFLDPGWNET